MSALLDQLNRYVDIRRSLGFKYTTQPRILKNFVTFADSCRAEYVTADLFLQWRESFGHANPHTWSNRLAPVRIFAGWLASMDSRHEIPPSNLIPARSRRSRPYIYSDAQIRNIVRAAADLPSVHGLRGLTYSTLFGLIAVTGLRISEAVALDNFDIDLAHNVVGVRCGKLGKERLLPISESTSAALIAYMKERNRLLGHTPIPLFVSEQSNRVTDCSTRYAFAAVSQNLGLRPACRFQKHGHGPRVHDLRHTFAARTMINWYRLGLDPEKEMIKLTNYLGHVDPKHTYWYIEAVPELLRLASERASQSLQLESVQ
jgi:site-specific recombinase XerD